MPSVDVACPIAQPSMVSWPETPLKNRWYVSSTRTMLVTQRPLSHQVPGSGGGQIGLFS
jgi:hypothetical protein